MPMGDRKGPWGLGPRSGRGLGYCSGYPYPGFMNPGPGFLFGRGIGRGFGRGLGFGRGRGFWRAGYGWGYPYPPEMMYGYPFPLAYPYGISSMPWSQPGGPKS
ncbi:MAG: DUF5320 domain-containing protein [Candidatus Aminicenantales bacterium]